MHPRRIVRGVAGPGWVRGVLGLLLLLAVNARALDAQRVNGRLLDAETGAPIAGATLLLVNEQGQTVHSVVSNGAGGFELRAPAPGIYRLRASRLGYREGTSRPVDLAANGVLSVELRLTSSAVQLEPLTVTGIPQYERLAENGFYERRDHFGPEGLREAVFLEQHDIERLNPFSVHDIFDHVRGVRTDRGGLTMRRGCQPAIVIDGFTTVRGRGMRGGSGRMIETPRSILGIEVYYGYAIPARYLLDAAGCGVIMFWTK
ncbi:MAG TPA: carboxypeptidase-like regulatory domain-containing protein [Longimicrobium sp.]|nr:carboxypeptidase-like regulatory domain-containing protein [Longimicrobium sp.]